MTEEKFSPRVSAIVSSNEFSRASVESLLAQTVTDIEIIIVGSTVEQLSDPRLKYIPGQKNLNANRNVGLERAVGEYVYLFDGNGMLFDNAFEILLSAAAESGADVIQSTNLVEREGEDVSIVGDQNVLSLNLYRRAFLELTNLKFPEAIEDDEPFRYAAEVMAPTVAVIDDYFYVRDRQQPVRAEREAYVKDIDRDEIRCGFLVTTQRKKLWNAQIRLILEFARVCRKYNLRWFAHSGTLLGAARHKGFIPWDDDVDLMMFRPDYDKFVKVAPSELKPEFFLDLWYDYRLEEEKPAGDEHLPMVSRQTVEEIRQKNWFWPIRACFAKLRDNTTTMVQWKDRKNVNQGIWIDIFALDPVPPFENDVDNKHLINFMLARELRLAAGNPPLVRQLLEANEKCIMPIEKMYQLLDMPFRNRALVLEAHMLRTFYQSEHVSTLAFYKGGRLLNTRCLERTIRLPFEEVMLDCPEDFDGALTSWYGNWHEFLVQQSHVSSSTADIPYKKFFELISPAIKEMKF
ncbi:MAG: LicD family protein [Selenomonadaceae bacterium]|nr:LicD family protein [Selenomonadaceae bacterium]MBR1579414.1 LicD family protein [Selenomonadaceae bacterium]